jgi:hypothetical protein
MTDGSPSGSLEWIALWVSSPGMSWRTFLSNTSCHLSGTACWNQYKKSLQRLTFIYGLEAQILDCYGRTSNHPVRSESRRCLTTVGDT